MSASAAPRQRFLFPLLALLAAVGVMIFAAGSAQLSLAELNAMADDRSRTRSNRLQLEQALSLFKDLETGSRGFVITGREEYLEPYRQAQAELPASYARLKAAMADRLPPGFAWPELDSLVDRRFALSAQAVAERRNRGGAALDHRELFDQGKAAMDGIRAAFDRLDAYQEERLQQLDGAVAELRRRAQYLAWVSTGTAVGLVFLAILLFLRERRLRCRLEEDLRQANLTLEERVQERTAELAEARDRLAGFAAELDRSIEAERRRLSREVHDQIGQVFTAIKMIFRSLPPATLPADQEEVLFRALDMGIATTRRIAAQLRPPLFDDLGLAAAVEHYAAGAFRDGGVACTVAIDDQEMLQEDQSLALFRIVQEACTNVLRHAEARQVAIRGGRAGAGYELVVEDDGRGFAGDGRRPGALGIVGMEERAEAMGATLTLEPGHSGGTRVRVSLPVQE